MRSRAQLRRWGAAFLLTMLAAAAAQAEPIPPKDIEVERRHCNASCTEYGAPTQPCAQYCDCTMKKMQAEISLEELATVSRDAAKDEQAPSTAVNKLAKIATACAQATPQ